MEAYIINSPIVEFPEPHGDFEDVSFAKQEITTVPVLQSGQFNVEFSDDGAGPPVILLHSSGSGPEQWRRLTKQLQDRFRLLAVNLMGYGQTSIWPAGTRQTLADQAALIETVAASVEGRISLIGHSFGAAVAMKAALALQDRLAHLILFEPNIFYLLAVHGHTDAFAEIKSVRDHFKAHGEKGDWSAVAAHFIDHWNGEGAWASANESRRAPLLRAMRGAFHEWDSVFDETTPVDHWAPLAERMVVIVSANTRASIRGVADILRRNLAGIHYVEVPEGGHMAPLTRPDLVNPILIDVLDRWQRRGDPHDPEAD